MKNEQRSQFAHLIERMRLAAKSQSCPECRGSGGFGPLEGKCPGCKGIGDTDRTEVTDAVKSAHVHAIVGPILLLDMMAEMRDMLVELLETPGTKDLIKRANDLADDTILIECWKQSKAGQGDAKK